MNTNWIPLPQFSSRVGTTTLDWWQDIGRSLMAFTEVEQLVLDWAVVLTGYRAWWQEHSQADLKKRIAVLRKALKFIPRHPLPPPLAARVDAVLHELFTLTDLRNDLAHMRLIYSRVPLDDADDEGDDWIPSASHVEFISRQGNNQPVLQSRDRAWIRSVADKALTVAHELQTLMGDVRQLQSPRVDSQ